MTRFCSNLLRGSAASGQLFLGVELTVRDGRQIGRSLAILRTLGVRKSVGRPPFLRTRAVAGRDLIKVPNAVRSRNVPKRRIRESEQRPAIRRSRQLFAASTKNIGAHGCLAVPPPWVPAVPPPHKTAASQRSFLDMRAQTVAFKSYKTNLHSSHRAHRRTSSVKAKCSGWTLVARLKRNL